MKNEDKILNAAIEQFLSSGFHGTKIRKIVSKAGGNIASVHYYFRSKEKLYKAVVFEIAKLIDNKNSLERQDILLFIIGEMHTNKNLFFEALSEYSESDWSSKIIELVKNSISIINPDENEK